VVAWMLVVPFIIAGSYFIARPLLRLAARRATPVPAPPTPPAL
jgi:hypothetical protein